ncbi:MAG: hypothetical protein ACPGXY_05060 [Alphaproteobacteria bacterium]
MAVAGDQQALGKSFVVFAKMFEQLNAYSSIIQSSVVPKMQENAEFANVPNAHRLPSTLYQLLSIAYQQKNTAIAGVVTIWALKNHLEKLKFAGWVYQKMLQTKQAAKPVTEELKKEIASIRGGYNLLYGLYKAFTGEGAKSIENWLEDVK